LNQNQRKAHTDESHRLNILRATGLLDSQPEAAFDDLVQLAATLCEAPISHISLIDEDRVWLKSCVGLTLTEAPRDSSFCTHAIEQDGIFVIPDALADPRFSQNTAVVGDPHIRFYAGFPLAVETGEKLGTLCVVDTKPRTLRPDQIKALEVLARQVMTHIQLKDRVAQLNTLVHERDEALASERHLRETEGNLKLAFAGANGVGTWQWDLRLGHIYADETFANFYGVDPELARRGAPLSEFSKNIPEEDLEVMKELVANAIETGERYFMEHRVIQDEDSVRWVETRAQCAYADDGTPVRFPGVVIDITQRKQHEEALIETQRLRAQALESLQEASRMAAIALADSEAKFRLLVEGVKEHALFTVDPEGIVTNWNRGAERLFGHKENEILGCDSACIYTTDDQTNGEPERLLWKARRDGGSEEEGWRVRANGTRFWASVRKTAFNDENGNLAGFAVIIQDTTERRRIASAIEDTRRERIRLQEKLLSHVSHELRTPLTAIYFFTSNVYDGLFGELNQDQREHLNLALENVKQLKEMVDDLLNITRVDSHKLSVVPQHAQPVDLVHKVLSTCSKNAAEKSITLRLHNDLRPDEELMLPAIWADPARVRQILTNLIDNGIKFTAPGGSVTVNVRRMIDDPSFLCFSVTDTGCGIRPEHLELVFERLAQVNESTENSRSGLGLGLYIARELILQHGGSIWLESDFGRGSTFYFTLPVFSLLRHSSPILTPDNLSEGYATLISVDIVAPEGTSRCDIVPELQKVLAPCLHPGKDVLLHWNTDNAQVATFLIVACADSEGSAVIASRITRELKNFTRFPNLETCMSSTTISISDKLTNDEKVREVTDTFEFLINSHLKEKECLV
jgi:PAS domain S-box-containing protein